MTLLTSSPRLTRPRARRRRDVKLSLPADLSPMLAVSSDLPVDDGRWAYEFKWDGVRAICYWDGRHLRLRSRNNLEMTVQYPELQALGPAIGNRPCILDGEVVALDDLDRPSFPRLQQRMKVTHAPTALALSKTNPVWLMLFDILWVDGEFVTRRPLSERRRILEELTVEGPNWQISKMYRGNGEQLLEAARANELEGIVCKRIDSTYEPGVRSSNWRKVKIILRQEFVIGGWTIEKGRTGTGVGALQVGYYDSQGKLRYAGGVGSGFTHATLADLAKRLAKLKSTTSPFADRLPKRGVNWVKPELIAEVEFRRWPEGQMLQQAAYKGLRFDKAPREVVREYRACVPQPKASRVVATPASPDAHGAKFTTPVIPWSEATRDLGVESRSTPRSLAAARDDSVRRNTRPARGDAGVAATGRRGAARR
jgi:bifunctional non-homologous end joining protein LigD